MKITVVGTGYVGLSNAVLLSQNNEVIALDVVNEKVDLINKRVSPIGDNIIEEFFKSKKLNLTATLDKEFAYKECEVVVIATPTDYDPDKNFFDTSSVDSVIEDVKKYSPNSTVIIKSTVPVGYTQKMQDKYPELDIIFSPEFLREGKALFDNLYPSRIIMGKQSKEAKVFANLLVEGALKEDIKVLYTNPTEAEAIKLFSNTYLAMRVSYFNELDTYAEVMGLDSGEIIKGVGLDPRIGSHYNNPSFGYGGYCLPKDTKQMLADYENIPQEMISAIVNSNQTRKEHIANMVLSKKPKVVGVYRLIMKTGSDNFRASSIIDVMNIIKDEGVKVVIFEPGLKEEELHGIDVLRDINKFKEISDIIITNRFFKELKDVKNKVYTRDIFNRD